MNQPQGFKAPTNINQVHAKKNRPIWPLGNLNLRRSISCVMLLCLWVLSSSMVSAENPTITEAQREFFEKKIRPVLTEQCLRLPQLDQRKEEVAWPSTGVSL